MLIYLNSKCDKNITVRFNSCTAPAMTHCCTLYTVQCDLWCDNCCILLRDEVKKLVGCIYYLFCPEPSIQQIGLVNITDVDPSLYSFHCCLLICDILPSVQSFWRYIETWCYIAALKSINPSM